MPVLSGRERGAFLSKNYPHRVIHIVEKLLHKILILKISNL